MGKHETPTLSLYDRDFAAWTKEQAAKLRNRAHNEVDWDNVAEEIDSLGRSEKNQIGSRMGVLLKHLLKWEFQPDRRSHSWQSTISEQRVHIRGVLQTSPSLKRYPAQVLQREYQWARRDAARETKLPLSTFPEVPAYSANKVLDDAFLPGVPWSPDTLIRD
jgi:hypothetical protein